MATSGKKVKARKNKTHDLTQRRQARTMDALIEFDQFNKSILPQLKKALLENWSPERMRKTFAPLVQAKVLEKALQGDFKSQKDVLDRHEGMAVQRVENKTVLAKMAPQEQAALMLQKLRDAKVIDVDGSVIIEEDDED